MSCRFSLLQAVCCGPRSDCWRAALWLFGFCGGGGIFEISGDVFDGKSVAEEACILGGVHALGEDLGVGDGVEDALDLDVEG